MSTLPLTPGQHAIEIDYSQVCSSLALQTEMQFVQDAPPYWNELQCVGLELSARAGAAISKAVV